MKQIAFPVPQYICNLEKKQLNWYTIQFNKIEPPYKRLFANALRRGFYGKGGNCFLEKDIHISEYDSPINRDILKLTILNIPIKETVNMYFDKKNPLEEMGLITTRDATFRDKITNDEVKYEDVLGNYTYKLTIIKPKSNMVLTAESSQSNNSEFHTKIVEDSKGNYSVSIKNILGFKESKILEKVISVYKYFCENIKKIKEIILNDIGDNNETSLRLTIHNVPHFTELMLIADVIKEYYVTKTHTAYCGISKIHNLSDNYEINVDTHGGISVRELFEVNCNRLIKLFENCK